jgi:molecular chaperone GrpE (heat shock protein)
LRTELEKANQKINEAEEDYHAYQADLELTRTINNHEIEMAVQKGIAEFKKELLGQSMMNIRKNMKEPPIDLKEE